MRPGGGACRVAPGTGACTAVWAWFLPSPTLRTSVKARPGPGCLGTNPRKSSQSLKQARKTRRESIQARAERCNPSLSPQPTSPGCCAGQRWSRPSPQTPSCLRATPVFGLFRGKGLEEVGEMNVLGTTLTCAHTCSRYTRTPSPGPHVHMCVHSQMNARTRPVRSFSHAANVGGTTTLPRTLG